MFEKYSIIKKNIQISTIAKQLFFTITFLLFAFLSFAQSVLLNESFDNATYTSPPALNWTTLTTSGTTTAHWKRVTSSIYPSGYSPYSGTGMALIDCYSNTAGNDEALISPRIDFSKTSNNTLSFWFFRHNYATSYGGSHLKVYINTSQSLTGATLLVDLNTPTASSPTVSSTGWYQYTYSIPPSYGGATNYILFNSVTDWYNDLFIDDVNITGSGSAIPPLAGFAYNNSTDTAWINSPYIFVNTSNNQSSSYWDIVGYSPTLNGNYTAYSSPRLCPTRWNSCYIDTVDENFNWKFSQTGYYKLKLKVTNGYGADSVTKIVVCAQPSQKPAATFFSINRSVGFGDQLNYYDLSSNGPTAWSWYLNPNYYGTNTIFGSGAPNAFYDPPTGSAIAPTDTFTQNPYLFAFDGGVFDVCLAVGNSMGWDTLCRHNYLTVNVGYEMCTGGDSVSTLSSGYLYDQGGPISNYTYLITGSCPAGFRIAACADTVILNIERFKLYAGDSLTIRIGSPYGPKIKTLGGHLPDSLRHIKVPSGIVFFNMNVGSSSPGDSGFAIHWTSVPANYGKPKGSFTFTTNGPTTNGIPSVYKGYTVKYTNTSNGINMGYSWDTNGDGIFGTSVGGDSINPNPSWVPSATGLYTVCLKVYNCVGQDSVCNKIRVINVLSKPIADMTVNKSSGFTTDTFKLYDLSTNGAISWQWSFSPLSVIFLNGTSANSQNPIVFFNSATCYTVTLRATNILGNSTKIVPCMVNVLAYNSPGAAYSIPAGSDVGISRVTLGKIDTTTALQSPVYTQMNNTQIATLYRGVDYTVTTYRQTNNDPMTTRVWIDWNMNANFTDPGETIIYEKSQYKISTTKTFGIPQNNPTGNARMRVGITYDSTTLTPDMAQLGCFEDYGIVVGVDYVAPVISLFGPAVYKMQVGKHYTEYGITASDNLEGDISSRYIRTGYLDTNTIGYYTLTYTVADLYGNISLPATRVVQVEVNQTGPTITLNDHDTAILGVNFNYIDKGATAVDNVGKNISNLITTVSNVNNKVLGTYSVVYSITDAFGFTANKTRTVIVVDTTAPVIVSVNGKTVTDTVSFQIGTPFNYSNLVWANDNYDGNDPLTQTGTLNVNIKGFYTLLFNATDASGNQANVFRLVVKVDNTILPVISLIDLPDITVDVNTVFDDPGVIYSSAYYGYGTLLENTTSNVDMTKIGLYTIKYCVTDPSNNIACVSRTVHVVDRIAPKIYLNGDNPYHLTRFLAYVDPGVLISDNYYTDSQLRPFLAVDSKVRNDIPGIYYVTFDLTDLSGNKANQIRRTVIVDPNTDPLHTGINSVSAIGKMKIYPNPNNGKFTVELENKTTVETIKIYSIIGTLIKEVLVNTNSKNIDIDMTGVSEGIYIVKLDGQSGSFTQKINVIK